MAPAPRCPDHVLMTTEQAEPDIPRDESATADPAGVNPAADPAGARPAAARHLRRRTSDRVIGGVAGGLGDYLNIDPILLRVAFAGLMIFGGAGIVLYVLGWLLIPDAAHDDSIAQTALRLVARRIGRLGAMVLVIIVVVVLSPWITNRFDSFYVQPEVFWALAIALIGIVLLLPRDQAGIFGSPRSGPAAGAEASAGGAAAPAWGQGVLPATPAPVRERSPLGWYVIAGALLIVGALAVVDTVATVGVLPGQYLGAGLLALGIGLVVGAWWGRARLLILLGLAVLPLAATSAFLTVPLEGGVADNEFRPQNLAEVQTAYRLAAGRLFIDLTDLDGGSEPIALTASVGIGDLFVLVPTDAIVEVTGTVQVGRLLLFGRRQVGTGLADHVAGSGNGAGVVLILTLDVGIGQVQVERSNVGGY
jgi:phage shock protein PspC (stress-responsive transcriptional regulator)